ncbi:MAG: hypothetical protein H0U57_10395 [Tatlockia sp.]|nr:hypothetical protein [Tatlockia sp.]
MSKNKMTKSESDLGKLGLKNAADVAAFLKTKTSDEIFALILQFLIKKKESDLRTAQHNLMVERQDQAILMQSAEKENENKERLVSSIILNQLPKQEEKNTKAAEMPEDNEQKKSSMDKELARALKNVEKTEETYKHYNDNIDKAEEFIKTLDSKDPLTQLSLLDAEIDKIAVEIEELEPEFYELLKKGDEEKARDILAQMNAKNLQIATLKDMKEACKGKKIMYSKEGEVTTHFENAHFIIPRDQILKKEGGNFYLLNKNENFENLTPAEKEDKQQNFEQMKLQISRVRDVVEHNKGLDLGEKIQEVLQIGSQLVDFIAQKITQPSNSSPQLSGMSATTSSAKVTVEGLAKKGNEQKSEISSESKPSNEGPNSNKIR